MTPQQKTDLTALLEAIRVTDLDAKAKIIIKARADRLASAVREYINALADDETSSDASIAAMLDQLQVFQLDASAKGAASYTANQVANDAVSAYDAALQTTLFP